MKRLAWFTGVVLATLTAVLLLWHFRSAIWLFLFSLAAAAAFRPPIKFLTRQGIPWRLALLLVYGFSLALVGGLLALLSLFLLTELQQLANNLAIGYEHIMVMWPDGTTLQRAVAARLPPSETIYEALVGSQGFTFIQTVIGLTSNLVENIAYLVIIVVLSIYWTADQVRFERLWLSLTPVEYRAQARDIWRDIETSVGDYIRSELIQSLLAGLLLGLGYWVIGIKYPTLLALIGGAVWLIPIMGLILALIPVAIVGVTHGLTLGIFAAGYALVVYWVLEWKIEPRFFDRQRFSSLLLVLTMIALIEILGPKGLIIAPPVAVAIQIFFGRLLQERLPHVAGIGVPALADLQERAANIDAMLAAQETPPSPKVVSLLDRLNDLIEEAAASSLTAAPLEEPIERAVGTSDDSVSLVSKTNLKSI